MSPRWIVSIVAAAGGGFLLARLATPLASASADPAPIRAEAPGHCPSLDASAIRAAIGAEIRAALREQVAGSTQCERAAEVVAKADAAPTGEALAADDAARALVDDALQRGRWREEDAIALRQRLPVMTDRARRESMSALYAALNEQRIRSEVIPPL